MKQLMADMPAEIRQWIGDADMRDCSSSPEARVVRIEREDGFYLKSAAPGMLKNEAAMDDFFFRQGVGPKVEGYWSDAKDWLLTRALPGTSGIDECWLEDPKRLSALMGEELRKLHEMDRRNCPVMDRTAAYLNSAEAGYRQGKFDPSNYIGQYPLKSADEAWRIVCEAAPQFQCDALLHGDYCLPNLMLKDWQLSGFIDVGLGGVGERHIDLFWGVWTLIFNLQTNRWGDRFLDAYGRDKVNADLLLAVEAAECFG